MTLQVEPQIARLHRNNIFQIMMFNAFFPHKSGHSWTFHQQKRQLLDPIGEVPPGGIGSVQPLELQLLKGPFLSSFFRKFHSIDRLWDTWNLWNAWDTQDVFCWKKSTFLFEKKDVCGLVAYFFFGQHSIKIASGKSILPTHTTYDGKETLHPPATNGPMATAAKIWHFQSNLMMSGSPLHIITADTKMDTAVLRKTLHWPAMLSLWSTRPKLAWRLQASNSKNRGKLWASKWNRPKKCPSYSAFTSEVSPEGPGDTSVRDGQSRFLGSVNLL